MLPDDPAHDPAPIDVALVRARFLAWVNNHPSVFRDANRFWHVQNCVGDLIDWVESPTDWLSPEELAVILPHRVNL